MLYIFLLAFFLIEFLVIIGVILFAIVFSRPEVPLKGDGGLERVAVGDGNESSPQGREEETTTRGNVASTDSHPRMSRLIAVRPFVFTVRSRPTGRGLYENAAQSPSWFGNN